MPDACLLVDALGMKFRELKLRKNPDCPVCGKNPTITKLIDYEEFCGIRGQEEPAGNDIPSISVEELKKKTGRQGRYLHPRRARAARISDL